MCIFPTGLPSVSSSSSYCRRLIFVVVLSSSHCRRLIVVISLSASYATMSSSTYCRILVVNVLLYCRVVVLSYCHIVELSYCRSIVVLSCCRIVVLSSCRGRRIVVVVLSSCRGRRVVVVIIARVAVIVIVICSIMTSAKRESVTGDIESQAWLSDIDTHVHVNQRLPGSSLHALVLPCSSFVLDVRAIWLTQACSQ